MAPVYKYLNLKNILHEYPKEQEETTYDYYNRIRSYANYYYDNFFRSGYTTTDRDTYSTNRPKYFEVLNEHLVDQLSENQEYKLLEDINREKSRNKLDLKNLIKHTKYYNRGLTLPFSHNTGPLNTLVKPSNTADEHAFDHDLAYEFDENVQEADKHFVGQMYDHFFENPVGSVESITGFLGALGISSKMAIESYIGQQYPTISGNVKTKT